MSGAAKSLLEGAQILSLDPKTIDTSDRIGFLHEDKAVAVGRLLFKDGQRDVIKVSKSKKAGFDWKLRVGLHRTMGALYEGINIQAVAVSGKPEELRDLEASENLHRRPLSPLERAKFVYELCRAAQERIAREHGELSQHQLAAKARWDRVKHGEVRAEEALQDESNDAADKLSAAYDWQEGAAEALDLSKRTIRRSLELYRLLIEPFPDLAEQLSKHPVVGENSSQLQAIANVRDEDLRRQVIEALVADTSLSADAARIDLRIDMASADAPTPDVKFSSTISSTWGRMSTRAKREFLPRFVSQLTPDLRSKLRALLDEEQSQ
ncbi:MAG: hypothetical protein AAGE86_03935 [Pseudomonadota bacterium]